MRKQQSGFTLIELVMVIVILGILAATALPKFIDLSQEAGAAAAKGAAGAIGAGTAINYSATLAGHTAGTVAVSGANVATSALAALVPGWDTAKLTIGTNGVCGTAGTTTSVTVTDVKSTQTASAVVICTG